MFTSVLTSDFGPLNKCPSLISLKVSVDFKHDVYLLTHNEWSTKMFLIAVHSPSLRYTPTSSLPQPPPPPPLNLQRTLPERRTIRLKRNSALGNFLFKSVYNYCSYITCNVCPSTFWIVPGGNVITFSRLGIFSSVPPLWNYWAIFCFSVQLLLLYHLQCLFTFVAYLV